MTITVSRPTNDEWTLTVWIDTEGDRRQVRGAGSDADQEFLAQVLAEFAQGLLQQPAARIPAPEFVACTAGWVEQ